MKKLFGRLAGMLLALTLSSGFAAAQSKVTIAVGGGPAFTATSEAEALVLALEAAPVLS